MSNTDDQRAAFEAWAKSKFVSTDLLIDNFGVGAYRDPAIQFAWQAWRAAIEHARLNPQADTQLATTHVPAP